VCPAFLCARDVAAEWGARDWPGDVPGGPFAVSGGLRNQNRPLRAWSEARARSILPPPGEARGLRTGAGGSIPPAAHCTLWAVGVFRVNKNTR